MSSPLLIDLFCGAGGSAKGYADAGFEILGVDSDPSKLSAYPFECIEADAMTFLLEGFDAIHASPPCQAYGAGGAQAMRNAGKTYPQLIEPTRARLVASGTPYIIENVVRSALIDPIRLCGEMFEGLNVVRHRFFESNMPLVEPEHPQHLPPLSTGHKRPWHPKDWRKPDADGMVLVRRSQYVSVAGFGGASGRSRALSEWQKAMGIDWMNKPQIVEAIPPAYTGLLGRQLLPLL